MGLLILLAVEIALTLHGIEDGDDLVAHSIISSSIGGGTQIKAI